MPSVEEFTDPHTDDYTPVPLAGAGICATCHNAPRAGYPRCSSCFKTARQVASPLELVVPISLYRVGEQLHTVLRGYKSASDATVRERLLMQVGATLHRFLRDHRQCIEGAAGTGWDTITIVPSTEPREGPHPLERAVLLSRSARRQYRSLLEPDRPELIQHGQASDEGFGVSGEVDGLRVLLVDDTFTTGATLQSAASTLTRAGATVVAGVVIGRVINPDFDDETRELWERQRGRRFDFDVCCIKPF
jgi:predicted amidophosphoribosyltransferase